MRSFCEICNYNNDDPVHNNTEEHCFNFLLYNWCKFRKALVKNRHGVEITVEVIRQDGLQYNCAENSRKGKYTLKITPDMMNSHRNTLSFRCTAKNIRKTGILFISGIVLHPYSYFVLHDPENKFSGGNILNLMPGSSYSFIVEFLSGSLTPIGSFKLPVAFNFQTHGNEPEAFTIARSINISIQDGAVEIPQEKSPFTCRDWEAVSIVMPTQNRKFTNHYAIPRHSYNCFKNGLQEFLGMSRDDFFMLQNLQQSMQPGYVTQRNYRDFWHNVLWLEEMGQTLMLKRYNMENVKVKLLGNRLLELEVPGLAEKRPSVITGDMIELRAHDDHIAYRGVIQKVNDKTVEIAYLTEEFLSYIALNPELELDVRFVMGRLPLERMHQGVDKIVSHSVTSFLFPTMDLALRASPQPYILRTADFCQPLVLNNREQRTAVLNILNGTSGTAPYIVFGPPGTGKTITIVEAILQIKKKTTKQILVCAPANAACDMLAEKLSLYCTKEELIRVMSETVETSTIHEEVLEYSNYEMDGRFRKITPAELNKYRIVVTTLILVGRYAEKYHPNVVFIDEAAQACEPEVVCAIGMLEGKQIVLAGDPKQLGPTTASRVAQNYKLGTSLLERLMDLELYQSGNENFITMLRQNFRSHSLILRIPNKFFYDNQLIPVSDYAENDPIATVLVHDRIQDRYNRKGKKKNRAGQAIEFCNVMSKESRQGRSPSYYNEKEMFTVLNYVKALVALDFFNEEHKVLPAQIGVVTPYIRQVYKIRETLKRNGCGEVEVGTTETFQGREKRIIIISTVRAQKDLLLFDKKYNLGFVKNEKRFNVALTRAKSKLIIIGCAHVLGTDSKWVAFIEECEKLGTFCGPPFARRTAELKETITNRMKSVTLIDSQRNNQGRT